MSFFEHGKDPSQNFIERYPQQLDALFLPKTIAVIGAKDTPASVGRTLLSNLMKGGFPGKIYPINPKRKEVLGLTCYPDVLSLPEPVDLAVIATPAKTVPDIIAQCAEMKIPGAVIISAGFKEMGPSGIELEEQILRHARSGNIRVIGPNCLGIMNPIYGLNATFAKGMALKGNIGFISQSGAMMTSVLDWSFQENIGFSSFVSIGSMCDVNWGDLIQYLGEDPHTESILVYMETVGNARSFLSAAREISVEKPIIVIKAGRSDAAAQAAASHTGSMAGSDTVFDAALERVGVLRVDTIGELFRIAAALAKQPRPRGPSLAIVTNAGGPAVLATDAAVLSGASLTHLDQVTIDEMDQFLPAAWSRHNPVDILGDSGPDQYAKSVELLAKNQETNGILVILSPQDVTDPTAVAHSLIPFARLKDKPILASWMGGESVHEGINVLNEAGIPCFEFPDDAAKTFAKMWEHNRRLKLQFETPAIREAELFDTESYTVQQEEVEGMLIEARANGITLLNEYDSKQLLAFYGIQTVETLIAVTEAEAVSRAKVLGFPVVLKLFSETITHKTDVGGVKLDLKNEEEVSFAYREIEKNVSEKAGRDHFQGVTVQRMVKREGYEFIIGSTTDPQFGPVILFGLGGQLVEVYKDTAIAIPPLNKTLARRLMEKTKAYQLLEGVRGQKPINIEQMEEVLVRFSRLIVENPRIKECDINPLLVSSKEIIALDCRVVLHGAEVKDDQLPELAIRPYPINYVVHWSTRGGLSVILRPIRPEDESMMIDFHKELSEESVRQRYFSFISLDDRIAHERLMRICFNDYDREFSIIAETKVKSSDGSVSGKIIGIARLSRIPGTKRAQMKLIIADHYHHQGIGKRLVQHLIHIAKKEKIEVIDAYILEENTGMLKLCENLGFELKNSSFPSVIHACKTL